MGVGLLSAPYRPAMGGSRIAAEVRPFCAPCTSVIMRHRKGPADERDGASTGGRLRDFCLIWGTVPMAPGTTWACRATGQATGQKKPRLKPGQVNVAEPHWCRNGR